MTYRGTTPRVELDGSPGDTSVPNYPALWQLLAPTPPEGRTEHDPRVGLHIVHVSDARWRQQLKPVVDDLPANGRLVVTCNRRASLAVLRLVASGIRERPRAAPALRDVLRFLRSTQLEVETAYRLWPSAARPSIAVVSPGIAAMRLMQRAGIMGGGRWPWIRVLARARVLTRVIRAAAPGIAVVVRRSRHDR